MAQFHEGQEVEVLTPDWTRQYGEPPARLTWRKARAQAYYDNPRGRV